MEFDDVTMCPYDTTHQVAKKRMQYHLVKCAKRHPEVVLQICPYNATHRIAPHDLEKHVEDCPSRLMYEEQCTKAAPKVYDFEIDDEVYERMRIERTLLADPVQGTVNNNAERKLRPPKTCPRALSVCGLSPSIAPDKCRKINIDSYICSSSGREKPGELVFQ